MEYMDLYFHNQGATGKRTQLHVHYQFGFINSVIMTMQCMSDLCNFYTYSLVYYRWEYVFKFIWMYFIMYILQAFIRKSQKKLPGLSQAKLNKIMKKRRWAESSQSRSSGRQGPSRRMRDEEPKQKCRFYAEGKCQKVSNEQMQLSRLPVAVYCQALLELCVNTCV